MKSIGTKPLHVFGQHHTWAEVACGEDAVWWMATGGVRRLDVDSHAIEAEIPLTEWPVHDQDRQTPEPTRLAVGAGGVWMTIGTAEIG